MIQLTRHISFEEMTDSKSHPELVAQNRIDAESYIDNLRRSADLLEIVRAHFEQPVIVHSGFRNDRLNAAVGGAAKSQHRRGEATDFEILKNSLSAAFEYVRLAVKVYDQVILEPGWIHVSIVAKDNRRQALIRRPDGKYEAVV